jgi:hypothetical protein
MLSVSFAACRVLLLILFVALVGCGTVVDAASSDSVVSVGRLQREAGPEVHVYHRGAYGDPAHLEPRMELELAVTTETETGPTHSSFFNRGSVATQEQARRLQNDSPSKAGPGAYEWLSRALLEALIAFLYGAGQDWAIHRAGAHEAGRGILASGVGDLISTGTLAGVGMAESSLAGGASVPADAPIPGAPGGDDAEEDASAGEPADDIADSHVDG